MPRTAPAARLSAPRRRLSAPFPQQVALRSVTRRMRIRCEGAAVSEPQLLPSHTHVLEGERQEAGWEGCPRERGGGCQRCRQGDVAGQASPRTPGRVTGKQGGDLGWRPLQREWHVQRPGSRGWWPLKGKQEAGTRRTMSGGDRRSCRGHSRRRWQVLSTLAAVESLASRGQTWRLVLEAGVWSPFPGS